MNNKEIAEVWIKRARSNIEIAEKGKFSEHVFYEDLCFECQQAAEKSIKALLILNNIEFPKTHSIEKLLFLLKKVGIKIPNRIDIAVILTDYAVSTRYPGEYEVVEIEEYEEALEIAKNVYNWSKSFFEN